MLNIRRSPELIGIITLFAVTAVLAVTENHSYTPDSARYAIWAQSLSDGNGFIDWTAPEPRRYVVHAPLYSLYLAPIAAIFSDNILALKYGTILLGVAVLILLYIAIQRNSGRFVAALCASILALNPLMLHYSTQLLSEMIFSVFFLGLLLSLERCVTADWKSRVSFFTVIGSLSACMISREIGVVLLVVVVLFLLIHEKYEHAGWVFVVVTIIFGAWYVRNEIIVAGREHPDLRNAILFSSNILTASDHSVWRELLARMSVNGLFYGRELHGLIFYPQFSLSGDHLATFYSVVDRTSEIMTIARRIVSPVFFLTAVASILLIFAGVYQEIRKGRLIVVYLVFFLLYSLMILIYPVADIRFLFPVLIIMVIFLGRGIELIVEKLSGRLNRIIVLTTALFLLPNLLWTSSYVHESINYKKDPIAYYQEVQPNWNRSSEYTKPFSLVAEWFNTQGDFSQVIVSRWKELGMELPHKKILILDAFSSLNAFEQSLRDYDVQYIVTTKDNLGWHEYEFQMNVTKHFSFRLVHSVAGVDIFHVVPVTSAQPKFVHTAGMFQYLFHHLDVGNYDTLRSFFWGNSGVAASHHYLKFFQGVTMECLEEYDSAGTYYKDLIGMPQGISLTQQVVFHSNMITQRKSVKQHMQPKERAEKLFNIAVNYWELDLRNMALRFLNATISEDRSYIPAYNLFIYFSLLNHDTLNAVTAFSALKEQFPTEPVVASFDLLFRHFSELQRTGDKTERAEIFSHIADDYERLGLSESRIESLRHSFLLDPSNAARAITLAALYEQKMKYYPALKILTDAQRYQPQSDQLQSKINEITSRY